MFRLFFFFFKQKTAYEMRISDWSSDVCSSDLMVVEPAAAAAAAARHTEDQARQMADALDAMATHGLATEQGRAADQRFHSLVIEAARNQLLSPLSSSIMAAVEWTTIFQQPLRALPRAPMTEHRAPRDRKNVVMGKSVSVRVDRGGRRSTHNK